MLAKRMAAIVPSMKKEAAIELRNYMNRKETITDLPSW